MILAQVFLAECAEKPSIDILKFDILFKEGSWPSQEEKGWSSCEYSGHGKGIKISRPLLKESKIRNNVDAFSFYIGCDVVQG